MTFKIKFFVHFTVTLGVDAWKSEEGIEIRVPPYGREFLNMYKCMFSFPSLVWLF